MTLTSITFMMPNADDQRHDRQCRQQHGEGARRVLLNALNVLLGGQAEVIAPLAVSALLDAVPHPQVRRDLRFGLLHAPFVGHVCGDLDPRLVLEESLHGGADR